MQKSVNKCIYYTIPLPNVRKINKQKRTFQGNSDLRFIPFHLSKNSTNILECADLVI